MPHRTTYAIGNRGKTSYKFSCPICKKDVTISGYPLRDFSKYPLNRSGQRLDYTFPDGSVEQGVLCNKCNDNHRNKVPLVKENGKWTWKYQ